VSAPNDGGPAFPTLERLSSRAAADYEAVVEGGMTLRDYFAGQALAGYCANGNMTRDLLVRCAYATADAMIAARGTNGH
jgi:hypothetical protein